MLDKRWPTITSPPRVITDPPIHHLRLRRRFAPARSHQVSPIASFSLIPFMHLRNSKDINYFRSSNASTYSSKSYVITDAAI